MLALPDSTGEGVLESQKELTRTTALETIDFTLFQIQNYARDHQGRIWTTSGECQISKGVREVRVGYREVGGARVLMTIHPGNDSTVDEFLVAGKPLEGLEVRVRKGQDNEQDVLNDIQNAGTLLRYAVEPGAILMHESEDQKIIVGDPINSELDKQTEAERIFDNTLSHLRGFGD